MSIISEIKSCCFFSDRSKNSIFSRLPFRWKFEENVDARSFIKWATGPGNGPTDSNGRFIVRLLHSSMMSPSLESGVLELGQPISSSSALIFSQRFLVVWLVPFVFQSWHPLSASVITSVSLSSLASSFFSFLDQLSVYQPPVSGFHRRNEIKVMNGYVAASILCMSFTSRSESKHISKCKNGNTGRWMWPVLYVCIYKYFSINWLDSRPLDPDVEYTRKSLSCFVGEGYTPAVEPSK